MVQKIIIDENCTKDHVKTLQRPCKDHYEVIVFQPIMFNFAAGYISVLELTTPAFCVPNGAFWQDSVYQAGIPLYYLKINSL